MNNVKFLDKNSNYNMVEFEYITTEGGNNCQIVYA